MHLDRPVSSTFLGTCVDERVLDSGSLHPSSSAVGSVEAAWASGKRLQPAQTILAPDWQDFVVEEVDWALLGSESPLLLERLLQIL